ncbi:hypothetical protein HDV05_008331 [Chytridiales sp. JEL 0842]|nr:hypothetical protein HDV05_008331 [Chytridiales sp. JEL 0842]
MSSDRVDAEKYLKLNGLNGLGRYKYVLVLANEIVQENKQKQIQALETKLVTPGIREFGLVDLSLICLPHQNHIAWEQHRMFGTLNRHALRATKALGVVGATWATDHYVFADSCQRNIRTVITAARITYEEGNFEQVHKKVADLILSTCTINAGLYIKFAQQIATVGTILPKEWSGFKNLYDKAPSVSYDVVESIFQRELGKSTKEIFSEFTEEPVASASIAQVHRARLRSTGKEVAVKIQKPEIAKQMDMDLLTFKVMTYCLEKVFDLPMYWGANFIEKHLREEVDFINEARNAEKAALHISEVPSLAKRVFVPKVYWNLTTSRVMTAEWMDGIPLYDEAEIRKEGFSLADIMTMIVNTFSDQIFRAGFVHCDPHPGNILIRRNPLTPKNPDIILLDHGLYVTTDPAFSHNYALIWKCLMTQEVDTVEQITKSWGIRDVQIFASGTLQRPWKRDKVMHVRTGGDLKDMYEMQKKAKERAKENLRIVWAMIGLFGKWANGNK